MTKLEDLKMVIEAIKATRARWITALDSKISEVLKDNPKKTYKEAFSQVIAHKEINEEFQNLISLYGIIGSEAESYVKALEVTEAPPNVVKLPKKAA
jgi:hypothetical protein